MTPTLKMLREIVAGQLCHRCGSCSGICPANVIRPDADDYPEWEARVADCTDCGLCVRVCPGRDFSFPDFYQRLFQRAADVRRSRGVFQKAFLGYATDPDLRAETASGGLATQIPLFLLKTGRIRGALVVRSDPERP